MLVSEQASAAYPKIKKGAIKRQSSYLTVRVIHRPKQSILFRH